MSTVAFHDNRHTIAVGSTTASLMIYDPSKPFAQKAQLEGYETQIKHVEFAYSREFRKAGNKGTTLRALDVRAVQESAHVDHQTVVN